MPWNETTKTEYTRPRARFESDLTDEEWILVEPCLPPPAKRGRPRKTDLRQGRRRVRNITVETQKVSRFKVLYRRWVVDRAFAWMSRCRRLAKDYEPSLESSLAWVQLAACHFMMRRIARSATC